MIHLKYRARIPVKTKGAKQAEAAQSSKTTITGPGAAGVSVHGRPELERQRGQRLQRHPLVAAAVLHDGGREQGHAERRKA